MNPLYRRMFQQPGASRQPMGILASSPEIMNVVQQRQQPVRMAQGGDVGLQNIVTQLETLKQSGDAKTLREIANDPNQSGLVKRIASNFADSLLSDSAPLIKVGDVNIANALSDAAGRKPIGQSVGGQERSDVITPQGDVNLSNVLSDFSGRKPIGQSVGGQERSAALSDAPSKIVEGLSTGLDEVGIGLTDVGQKISSAFSPSQGVGTYRSPAEKQADVKSRLDKVLGFRGFLRPDQDTPDSVVTPPAVELVPDMPSENLMKPSVTPANLEDDFITSGFVQPTTTPTTPTQDGAAADAKKETDKKPSASRANTDKAIASIQDIFAKAKQGLQGDTNLPSNQATNPEVAGAFAVEYGQFAEPDDVDLNKIQDAIDATFGDKKDFTQSKKDAFWMGLMQAGLAMAAGESDNAMTNIAKGLSFGLTQYGKDIGELTEQQREDEKERRLFKTQMIRDERSANIAKAANKNQWTAAQNQLKQADASEKRTQAWKEKKLGIDTAFAMANLETNVLKSVADLELRQGTLDETTRSNLETESIARLKETPETLKLAREFGWLDEKNNVTDKGRAEAGETLKQVIMDAEIIKARGTTTKLTDEDKLTSSLQRLISGTGDQEDRARVLASSAGQAAIKDAGGDINEALKTMFAKMNPNAEPTDQATLNEAAQRGLVWDPNARAGNGRLGAFVAPK